MSCYLDVLPRNNGFIYVVTFGERIMQSHAVTLIVDSFNPLNDILINRSAFFIFGVNFFASRPYVDISFNGFYSCFQFTFSATLPRLPVLSRKTLKTFHHIKWLLKNGMQNSYCVLQGFMRTMEVPCIGTNMFFITRFLWFKDLNFTLKN